MPPFLVVVRALQTLSRFPLRSRFSRSRDIGSALSCTLRNGTLWPNSQQQPSRSNDDLIIISFITSLYMGSGITSFPSAAAVVLPFFILWSAAAGCRSTCTDFSNWYGSVMWEAGQLESLSCLALNGKWISRECIMWICVALQLLLVGFVIVGFFSVEVFQLTAQTRRPFE